MNKRNLMILAVVIAVVLIRHYYPELMQDSTRQESKTPHSSGSPSVVSPSERKPPSIIELQGTPPKEQASASDQVPAGNRRVERAFARRESDVIVEVLATVIKLFRDDNEGSRHQVFLVRLHGSRQTLKIAHNIDLARRVPVKEGDQVRIKGEYEYNDRGGVLHWTHRDPRKRHADGWIEFDGRRYQ